MNGSVTQIQNNNNLWYSTCSLNVGRLNAIIDAFMIVLV